MNKETILASIIMVSQNRGEKKEGQEAIMIPSLVRKLNLKREFFNRK